MKISDRSQAIGNNGFVLGDDATNDNSTSEPDLKEEAIEYSVLQQCYDILEKEEGSPQYLSLVAIAIEAWNSVCGWEGE